MKKLVVIAVLLALVLGLAGCGNSITVGAFSSVYLDGDEYDAAVQELMTHFNSLSGCTLKMVGYAGDKEVKAEAEARGLGTERIIVLTSTFETDGTSRDDGLEPNKTYEDYRWILTRLTSADPFWTIEEQE